MADNLDFGPVQQLVQLLVGAGVRATTNPEDLNLPGAWVTVDTVAPLVLGGPLELRCLVYLVTGDTDYAHALDTLAGLYNRMATVLTPDGDVATQGVVLPGNPTPLPALRVPVNLTTNGA